MSITRIAEETKTSKRYIALVLVVLAIPLYTVFKSSNDTDCSYSKSRSDGFFCDKKEDWLRKRSIFLEQESKQVALMSDRKFESRKGYWWQYNYEPNFSCTFEKRLGPFGDGGKWICDPHRIREIIEERNEKCLVFSFGSANRYDFEESVIDELPACEVHTFDHTIEPIDVPDKVNFHKIGLNHTNSKTAWTLKRIINKLSLNYMTIEILKMDIEGWEWDVLVGTEDSRGILFQKDLPFFRQLAIELHPHDIKRTRAFFTQMKALGYVIAHKEPNTLVGGQMVEYLFVKAKF